MGEEPMRGGYVKQSHVIALAEAAGFVLEETSDINANPADDHDHPVGVWTLRPTRATPREGTPQAEGFDRAAYDAIGESDRMTYRFRKPAE
jgi:predicted methyltransferase